MFLLKHSTQIPELLLQSEEEYRFYTELKRRTEAITINDADSSLNFIVGENKVCFIDGEIVLFENDRIVGKCLIGDFAKKPNAEFKKLFSKLKN